MLCRTVNPTAELSACRDAWTLNEKYACRCL